MPYPPTRKYWIDHRNRSYYLSIVPRMPVQFHIRANTNSASNYYYRCDKYVFSCYNRLITDNYIYNWILIARSNLFKHFTCEICHGLNYYGDNNDDYGSHDSGVGFRVHFAKGFLMVKSNSHFLRANLLHWHSPINIPLYTCWPAFEIHTIFMHDIIIIILKYVLRWWYYRCKMFPRFKQCTTINGSHASLASFVPKCN